MSDSGKPKGRVNMENAILEMQQNLSEGLFIAFVPADYNGYYSLTKSDDIHFLDSKTLLIKRKNGRNSIINLNLIVEIDIRRGLL